MDQKVKRKELKRKFTYTRIYSDRDGETHLQTVEVDLKNRGQIGWISESFEVLTIAFRENDADYNWGFHKAPRKQFIIILDGSIEIQTSTGSRRLIKAGQVLSVEDTQGKGHKTKNMSKKTRRSIFITYK